MANKNKKKFQRQLHGRPGARWFGITLAAAVALVLVLIALSQIPAIQNHAYYYVAKANARIQYFFSPPGKKSFNPGGQGTLAPEVAASLTAMAPTPARSGNQAPMEANPSDLRQRDASTDPNLHAYSQHVIPASNTNVSSNNRRPTNPATALLLGLGRHPHVVEKVIKPRKKTAT